MVDVNLAQHQFLKVVKEFVNAPMRQRVLPATFAPGIGHRIERIQIIIVAVPPVFGVEGVAQRLADHLHYLIETNLARQAGDHFGVIVIVLIGVPCKVPSSSAGGNQVHSVLHIAR